MTVPGVLTLSQVKVCELTRKKQKAVLYTNPLGKACYELNKERVKACLDELDRVRLIEAGLVYASEVRPTDRSLNAKEWRVFQAEVGCQPLHLACLSCGQEVDRLLKEGAHDKAKAVQVLAGDVVKLLVEYGARLDMADVGPMERTALHVAARFGAAKLLSTLLVLGADVGALDGDGCTAELVARRAGQLLCQQILQVVMAEEQKETDLLNSPKVRERRQRQERKAPTKEPDAEEPTEGVQGARYVQGLWATLTVDASSEDSSSPSDQDHTQRLLKLRQRVQKRRDELSEQLNELETERQAVVSDTERLENLLGSLKERCETLKDRLARFDAGDQTAQEEIASERELREFWEKRATASSEMVNKLLGQRKRMRQEKSDAIHCLEKELKSHQRKVQGLEDYWQQFFEADCAGEVIEFLRAEQRCQQLQKELVKMTTYFQEQPLRPWAPEGPTAALAWRRVHSVAMGHRQKLNEMVDFCNSTIAEKERRVLSSMQDQLLELVRGIEEPWATLALIIAQCRERLDAVAKAHEASQEKLP